MQAMVHLLKYCKMFFFVSVMPGPWPCKKMLRCPLTPDASNMGKMPGLAQHATKVNDSNLQHSCRWGRDLQYHHPQTNEIKIGRRFAYPKVVGISNQMDLPCPFSHKAGITPAKCTCNWIIASSASVSSQLICLPCKPIRETTPRGPTREVNRCMLPSEYKQEEM